MATLIRTPLLGQAIANVTVIKWSVAEGDKVRLGDTLLEVDTDKMAIEIPSGAQGILLRILCAAGESAPEGTPLAVIGAADEDISELLREAGA
jgi:pyruvate/2-oxoglutarate dehydrogenase complex dihydrolipoamide acyltransferase (E2) component